MFATIGALTAHRYASHENKYERYCELCGLKFASKIRYDTHKVAKHSNLRPFTWLVYYWVSPTKKKIGFLT